MSTWWERRPRDGGLNNDRGPGAGNNLSQPPTPWVSPRQMARNLLGQACPVAITTGMTAAAVGSAACRSGRMSTWWERRPRVRASCRSERARSVAAARPSSSFGVGGLLRRRVTRGQANQPILDSGAGKRFSRVTCPARSAGRSTAERQPARSRRAGSRTSPRASPRRGPSPRTRRRCRGRRGRGTPWRPR